MYSDTVSRPSAIITQSIQNGFTYKEIADVKRLYWIIQHASELDLGRSYVRGKYIEGDAQLTLIKKYYKRLMEGSIVQNYFQKNMMFLMGVK